MTKQFAQALMFLCFWTPAMVLAQTAAETGAEEAPEAEVPDEALLSDTELQQMVAPVALYPDTVLIQILVAATVPMEVVKADRLLAVNAEADEETIKTAVEAEEWDDSVEVLAVAFPEVITDMAEHIEWTETMGDAMLAQSDDVMAAVQIMREQAVDAGTLVSGEQQVVEVTENEGIIVQPADPEVVYVPQYDPEVVYVDNSNTVGDAFAAGLVAFTTFTIIDEIFDDDDDWNDYWGCRNCAGWGGRPIYRNPDIDIDRDINIDRGDREVNIGGGDRDIDISNRPDRRPDGSWKPDEARRDNAKNKIANRKTEGGTTKLPVNKKDSRSDALRTKLSTQSGTPDISRPNASIKPEAVRKTMGDVKRPAAKTPKVNRPKPSAAVQRPKAKAPVKKPSVAKNHVKKPVAAKPRKKPSAMKKRSSAPKARRAAGRGKASGRKARRRG